MRCVPSSSRAREPWAQILIPRIHFSTYSPGSASLLSLVRWLLTCEREDERASRKERCAYLSRCMHSKAVLNIYWLPSRLPLPFGVDVNCSVRVLRVTVEVER